MTLQTSGRNSSIKMDQKRTDSESQSLAILFLIRNKPEIDSILAGNKKSVDLTQDDPGTVCVSAMGRDFAIKGLQRAILLFQLLDRQVYDNGITMRDNCKTRFREQIEFLESQIEEINEKGFDLWTTDKITEFASLVNLANFVCTPDLTTPSDLVSFFYVFHFFFFLYFF